MCCLSLVTSFTVSTLEAHVNCGMDSLFLLCLHADQPVTAFVITAVRLPARQLGLGSSAPDAYARGERKMLACAYG